MKSTLNNYKHSMLTFLLHTNCLIKIQKEFPCVFCELCYLFELLIARVVMCCTSSFSRFTFEIEWHCLCKTNMLKSNMVY